MSGSLNFWGVVLFLGHKSTFVCLFLFSLNPKHYSITGTQVQQPWQEGCVRIWQQQLRAFPDYSGFAWFATRLFFRFGLMHTQAHLFAKECSAPL